MSLATDIRTELAAIVTDTTGLAESLTIDGTTVYGVPRAAYQGAQFGISEAAGMLRTFRCKTSDLDAIPAGLGSIVVHDGNAYAIQHLSPDEQSGLTVIELTTA